MNKYLEGYLSSIPESEIRNIKNFLKQYAVEKLNLPESEFQQILDILLKEKVPATTVVNIDENEKPKNTYNKFFSKVSIDLVYLFKIIELLYEALESYTYLSSSYFSDIKNELDKLKIKIDNTRAKIEYDANTIIITENFNNTSSFEEYNPSTMYLFVDRDGVELEPADLIVNNDSTMISLSTAESKDLLHKENGKPIGAIEILDFRGVPKDTYFGPEYAIDNSEVTYWDCSILSKIPIKAPIDNLEPNGAYMKFKIILPKVHEITEISITPYCIYPVEVSKILIGNKDILSDISNPINSSVNTMTFNFPPVIADEITFIIRQKNYTEECFIANEKIEEAEELWNDILDIKKFSYINTPQDNEYKDNEKYVKYMSRKAKEIELWNESYLKGV